MKLVFNIPVINTVKAQLSSRAVSSLQRRLKEAQDYIQLLKAQIKAQDDEGNSLQSTDPISAQEQQPDLKTTLHATGENTVESL